MDGKISKSETVQTNILISNRYGSAYLLTLCAFPLFYGKLYTFFPLKWVFLSAISLFEIGSLICGIAPTSNTLIAGRAVAGLGAAGIFTGSLLILMATVTLQQRPIYVGLVGAMYGIAGVAGPLYEKCPLVTLWY